ncbi:MAG: S-methyl-5'-thioadenosine phosphorylase [Anaerolineae bacterium]|jgi:5'-methylthioadenosine phosphorylase|nr:S-methyl-5'-thioadenosine phosphorylase [Chloroflexota bacterium]
MENQRIGIIGGSGMYAIDGLSDIQPVLPSTPYGAPSDEIVLGTLGSVGLAFLPRHGRGHRLSPSEVPSRANIWALKSLGVTHILSVSAVGSLRSEMAPRDLVLPDQLIDRTKGIRPASFFGEGVVAHIGFAEPFCPEMRRIVYGVTRSVMGDACHNGGTLVVMEGPQFSTRAESRFYRQIGGDLIGMTALPEAKLAREAGICYCTLAMVTDYDSWHETTETVTVEMVVANMSANLANARAIVAAAAPLIAASPRHCGCAHALHDAIMTQQDQIPSERRAQLDPLIRDLF